MSAFLPEYRFIIPLAAGIIGAALLLQPAIVYLDIIILLILISVFALTRTWHDRGFYLVCSSVPLMIGAGMMNLWAGMMVIWMVAGTLCTTLGLLASRQDLIHFIGFCGWVLIVTLLIEVSNHVLLPLLILAGSVVVVLAIQSVRAYQFRRYYSGAEQ